MATQTHIHLNKSTNAVTIAYSGCENAGCDYCNQIEEAGNATYLVELLLSDQIKTKVVRNDKNSILIKLGE